MRSQGTIKVKSVVDGGWAQLNNVKVPPPLRHSFATRSPFAPCLKHTR